jgi:hypothetical protein
MRNRFRPDSHRVLGFFAREMGSSATGVTGGETASGDAWIALSSAAKPLSAGFIREVSVWGAAAANRAALSTLKSTDSFIGLALDTIAPYPLRGTMTGRPQQRPSRHLQLSLKKNMNVPPQSTVEKETAVKSRIRTIVFRALAALGIAALPGLAQANTETVLYRFQGAPDGYSPSGPLLIDASRSMYGVTYLGGAYTRWGTVFKVARGSDGVWNETVLYSFRTRGTGLNPVGPLLQDSTGALYGITASGGNYFGRNYGYGGTVFKLTPPTVPTGSWTEKVIYKFLGATVFGGPTDGQSPNSLISDGAGGFFGTTSEGGIIDAGIVFHLSPPAIRGQSWTETVVHSFSGDPNGSGPSGLIMDAKGNLYGGTWDGNVFMLSPTGGGNWTFSKLYHFSNFPSDLTSPVSGLVMDGNGALYGATFGETVPGVIFKLTPTSGGTWTEQTLFTVPNGGPFYSQTPTFSRGSLYVPYTYSDHGQTCANGVGCGLIYKLTPGINGAPWTTTVAYNFQGSPDGGNPFGGLTTGTGGGLYGVTLYGGTNNTIDGGLGVGTVFKLDP